MYAVMDLAARRLTVAAIGYYKFGYGLMQDYDYDVLSKLVAHHWDYLSTYYQEVFESPVAIAATGSHIMFSEAAYRATLHELREAGVDYDLGGGDFKASAEWEGPNGERVPVMGFGE